MIKKGTPKCSKFIKKMKICKASPKVWSPSHSTPSTLANSNSSPLHWTKEIEEYESGFEEESLPIPQDLLNSEKKSYNLGVNPLEKHKISEWGRRKMIEWQIESLGKCNFSDSCLFRAIRLLDLYLSKETLSLDNSALHMLGMACMCLSTKYEEQHPITASIAASRFLHFKYTPTQVTQTEIHVLSLLNYRLSSPTLLDFIVLFSQKLPWNLHSSFTQLAIYLGKMVLFDTSFSKIKLSLLALACLSCANNIFKGRNSQRELCQEDQKFTQLVQSMGYSYKNVQIISQFVLDNAELYNRKYNQFEIILCEEEVF